MISFGTRITDIKKEAIRYVMEKVKNSGLYRNKPGDLEIRGERCFIVHTDGKGTIPLDNITLERIGELADKAQFRSVKYPIDGVARKDVKKEDSQKSHQKEGEDMNFEIKNDIPLPGQTFVPAVKIERKNSGKALNYRTVPLKDMKVGDCIILHECNAVNFSSKYGSARQGIERFVALMDTKKKFKVAKTDDFKVGVWRIE